MGQVVNGRKRGAIGQPRLGLNHGWVATNAARTDSRDVSCGATELGANDFPVALGGVRQRH